MKIKNSEGFREAIKLFKEAAKRVPAYKTFLKKNKINPARVRSYADFLKIPATDKKNYILRYNWRDLFYGRKIPPMLYASSGSSGRPTFWFRSDEQERYGADVHEKIFGDIFKIKKDEPTLVIICFSMGLWIAGNYTLSSLREVARRGYDITIATPGIEKEDIIIVVKNIAPRFKNVVFAGYPAFLMYIFDDLKKRRTKLPKNTKVITAGDKFSEKWRDAMLGIIKAGDLFESVIGIYGSADAAAMGHETPLSIAIRKIADKNAEFRRKLFGDGAAILPALIQYDPKKIFFEEADKELILTVRTSAPLIRYDIHDVGRVLPYKDMMNLLKTQKGARIPARFFKQQWKAPFLFVKSRTDVAATFYAINIFPEHLTAGIVDRRVKKFFSGNFMVYNKNVRKEKEERLYINLELAPGIRASKTIRNKAEKSIIANLCELSIEYRKLFSAIRERAIPIIKLYAYRHEDFTRFLSGKALVRMEGKKPKIILKQ